VQLEIRSRGSAGILPACLPRQNGARDVRRKAGETPALPAFNERDVNFANYLVPRW
jgi:hypothetical protein